MQKHLEYSCCHSFSHFRVSFCIAFTLVAIILNFIFAHIDATGKLQDEVLTNAKRRFRYHIRNRLFAYHSIGENKIRGRFCFQVLKRRHS